VDGVTDLLGVREPGVPIDPVVEVAVDGLTVVGELAVAVVLDVTDADLRGVLAGREDPRVAAGR